MNAQSNWMLHPLLQRTSETQAKAKALPSLSMSLSWEGFEFEKSKNKDNEKHTCVSIFRFLHTFRYYF